MDSFAVVLLLLAIFILPEINNIFKKKQKYRYPDEVETQSRSDMGQSEGVEAQTQELNINWDEIFGLEEPELPETEVSKEEQEAPVVILASEEEMRVREKEKPQTINPRYEKQVKITAKQALQGMIMAEVMGKPRAMRPVEKLVFYANKKNKIS